MIGFGGCGCCQHGTDLNHSICNIFISSFTYLMVTWKLLRWYQSVSVGHYCKCLFQHFPFSLFFYFFIFGITLPTDYFSTDLFAYQSFQFPHPPLKKQKIKKLETDVRNFSLIFFITHMPKFRIRREMRKKRKFIGRKKSGVFANRENGWELVWSKNPI